jgi:hypothetical protein
MRTHTVLSSLAVFAVWTASVVWATEPTKAPAAKTETATTARLSADEIARQLGVTTAELKQLRKLGFADSEIFTQVVENQRTARQVVLEREIINELAKALAEANVKSYKLSASEQSAQRERSMKAALAKVRRDYQTNREELRRILAGTSLLNPQEMKRCLGIPLFDTDNLRRVVGTSLFGDEQ